MSIAEAKGILFVEFKEHSMHALRDELGFDFPLERDANGRIANAMIDRASNQLRSFLEGQDRIDRSIVYCSIPCRGVSLRRMSIPPAPKEELQRMIAMQLEAQLPVAPVELAWGCASLAPADHGNGGNGTLQEFLAVALRKESLEDYRKILSGAGLAGVFTVGALSRRALCMNPPARFSFLEAGRTRSELSTFDERGALSLRGLSWGTDLAATALDGVLQNGGQKLYVSGATGAGDLPVHFPVELLSATNENGRTAANLGLQRMLANGTEVVLLGAPQTTDRPRSSAKWNWVALTAFLAIFALSLRYAEAVVYRARLARKLASISTYRSTLPKIEREFNFLNFIKTNPPPYLDVLTVLALAAQPGTRIETLSLVRNGDLTLRGNAEDAQAPGTFRSKLIDSGFFSRVVVDEQTPSADGQKVTFRLSAQVKSEGTRKPLALPPQSKTAPTNVIKTTYADPPKT